MLACTGSYLCVGRPFAAGLWSPIAETSDDALVAPLALISLKGALATYGYLAVFAFVGIESLGIPFPGERPPPSTRARAGTSPSSSWLPPRPQGPSSATT